MMKKLLLGFVACCCLGSTLSAQVRDFKSWVGKPEGKLVEQKFAGKALKKAASQEAAVIVDSLWRESTKTRYAVEWRKLTFKHDTLQLLCAARTLGKMPADGRSLYISMHGGGAAPAEVNNEQWLNQIYLYTPKEGVYVAPRAPWNAWDMWAKQGLDELLKDLIQAAVVYEGVNPDKVYLLGYSAGGDGVWRMAPRMADHWAAASMMAGHPGITSQVNLRNLPYMIWMGEHDSAYDRNRLAVERGMVMDSLQQTDPEGYIHETHIIKGKGHWMEQADTAAIPWMAKFRRNPYPQKVVWRQEEVVRPCLYWLSAPQDELETGKKVVARREGNDIHILSCDYSRLTIYLNDEMVNLDKPVNIYYQGKKVFGKKVKRTIANLHRTITERGDQRYMFPAVVEVKL